MWNRACYRVCSVLTELMGSLKWKQLWNSWKAGKIIAFDRITQAAQGRTALPDRVLQRRKKNQNKLPQNTSSEQQWESWWRDYSITLSYSLLQSFRSPVTFLSSTVTCDTNLKSWTNLWLPQAITKPSHNPGLNSQYTALKTFFPPWQHMIFF